MTLSELGLLSAAALIALALLALVSSLLAALWAGWLSVTNIPSRWVAAAAVHLLPLCTVLPLVAADRDVDLGHRHIRPHLRWISVEASYVLLYAAVLAVGAVPAVLTTYRVLRRARRRNETDLRHSPD